MILIVDDRLDSANVTEMALSLLDPEVRTESVSSGEQALAFLRTVRDLPELILLDLNMPGMNGIETLIQIHADDRIKDIPVVVLESDKDAARRAGASGFIQKAIRLHELSRDLEQHIKCWYLRRRG